MFKLITLAALTLSVPSAAAVAAPVTAAQIRGPLPVTVESGEIFRGSNEQPVAGPGAPMPELDPYGYTQEEYIVSGTVDGKPYSTTLLVRKPKDPAKFTGLVGVETVHAAGAIPFWGTGREVWAPSGHAWVAVASQRAALEDRVKKFNPKRYASLGLAIPEAAPTAQEAAPLLPGGGPQDLISQAIMAQVGAMLKSNPGTGPLKGMKVKYLLLGGASQTGGTTLRYIAQSHASARMPNGDPIFDGYFPSLSFPATPVSTSDVPIVHLVSEGDLVNYFNQNRPISFRADSDAMNDRYRHYELTGGSHVPTRGQAQGTDSRVPSQYPSAPFTKMALLHLIDWVTKGAIPPKAPRIDVADSKVVRDAVGNAKGGLRSAWVDVPSARIIPAVSAKGEPNSLTGSQEPIAAEQMKVMYGTRAEYLRRFNASIDKSVADKWLTRADGDKLKAEEAVNPPF